jgi:tetratricopeptide (TPR) repeat protein
MGVPKTIAAYVLCAYVLATLGDALLELGRYAEAEDAYGELRRKAPGNPAVLARDARLAEIHGKNDQAVSLVKQAADAVSRMAGDRGEVAWYRTRIGEILFRTGRLDQAEEQYRAALDARPDDYGASEHMAELRAAQEKYDEAVALYEAAATRWPRPEMFQALGDLYAFRRRPDQAKPWHDRAIAIYLRDAQRGRGHYYHHLAAFYSDSREDAAEAVRWAEKDLEVRQSIYAYDALGWALYRAGRFPEAAAAAKRALAAGTQDAHLLYHAGMIESRAGNAQRGAELLRQALAVNPRHQSFHVHR